MTGYHPAQRPPPSRVVSPIPDPSSGDEDEVDELQDDAEVMPDHVKDGPGHERVPSTPVSTSTHQGVGKSRKSSCELCHRRKIKVSSHLIRVHPNER
jgi:hypothetical protein